MFSQKRRLESGTQRQSLHYKRILGVDYSGLSPFYLRLLCDIFSLFPRKTLVLQRLNIQHVQKLEFKMFSSLRFRKRSFRKIDQRQNSHLMFLYKEGLYQNILKEYVFLDWFISSTVHGQFATSYVVYLKVR